MHEYTRQEDRRLTRQDDESAPAWLARLEALRLSELDTHGQALRSLHLRAAGRLAEQERKPQQGAAEHQAAPSPFAICQEAIRALPLQDRQQLARWFANGMGGCPPGTWTP